MNDVTGDPNTGDLNWRGSVDARLAHLDGSVASLDGRVGRLEGAAARLEGAVEGVKSAVDGLRWFVGIIAIVVIGGFSFLGFQLNRLEGRVDRVETAVAAIPSRLSDEFRAMRSEMSAQTNAIANSITATRQSQPPPPRVIVLPSPQPAENPTKP